MMIYADTGLNDIGLVLARRLRVALHLDGREGMGQAWDGCAYSSGADYTSIETFEHRGCP